MEFITLLLSGHLILIFVTAFSPDENLNTESGIVIDKPLKDFNLSDDILPSYYDIELVLDIEKDIFYGSCNINIKVLKDIRNIRLHSANLNITNSMLTIDEFKRKLHNVIYMYSDEIVSLDFNNMLYPKFHYTLNITFTGIISNVGGLFKTSYVNKEGYREWLIATYYNSKIGTRRLFPCWDEPRFKANFSISLKYHSIYTAFSNMPIVSSWWTETDTKQIVTRFATTPAIPTYLIAIVLIRFSKSSFYSISMSFSLWGRFQVIKYLTYADGIIKKITETFENEQPYMRKDLNEYHFSIPGWLEDGMDKWQIVFYREANIIFNDEIDPIARKIEISRLIARKLAGQWIDSSYSLQWSHMWLHESISTLLGINILNKTVPDFRIMDLFVVQTLQESLRLDNNTFMKSLISGANNISEINSLFSFAYYLKGPVIMRMLQHTLGNEVFQEGINIYLSLQLSSLDSFLFVMQVAYNESTVSPVINVKEVMDSWVNQNYYPILNVEQSEDKIVEISAQTDTWCIPLTYNIQTYTNFEYTLPVFWLERQISPLTPKKKNFPFPNIETDWIILNSQQTGYYRVNYYTENWRAIADYLSSKHYTKVHVLNRAQIIDDAFYFMITDQLEPSIFWKLTNFLSQESDYIVWYPLFKAIEYMSCSYAFHENQDIKAHILILLDLLLDKIGYEEHSEENPLTKCLRQEAAKWACVLGDNECQSKAKALLSKHLSNPKTDYILPWWKEWTYCYGLSTADVTVIDKVYETSYPEKNDKTLEFLSCSNYHVIKQMTFVKIITEIKLFLNIPHSREEQNVRRRIYINMFHRFVQRHAKNEEALVYILSIWKDIKHEVISSTALLINIINHVYAKNHLDKIMEFVKNIEITVNHKVFGAELLLNEQTINERIKNIYLKEFVSRVQRKIDIRLSQIKKHTDSVVF